MGCKRQVVLRLAGPWLMLFHPSCPGLFLNYMGSWHLNLCQIFINTFFFSTLLLLSFGHSWETSFLEAMEVLGKSSMFSYDLFCPVKCWEWVSWDLCKEYGSVMEWALVYFYEQPQSISFLFFHFTDFPAVLPSCSISTGHTPPTLTPPSVPTFCCCSSLSVVAVPGLSLCPDLFISLFCLGAATEYMGVCSAFPQPWLSEKQWCDL